MNEQSLGSRIGAIVSPVEAMRLALAEGAKGAGFVSPNPLVGCALLDREHRLLAVGFHRRVGFDHAEIDALRKVTNPTLLEGGHAYVTLEPCAHQGRTPSCAKTLAPLKLASLTYAVEDPNPLVSGQGAAILLEAGTKAQSLKDRQDISASDRIKLIADAEVLAEVFLHNMRVQEPFVAVKIAATLDGKMGLASGESKWITGQRSREHVQLLRARYDAVVVGRNTWSTDNPSLNVRHHLYPQFRNKAVILDPQGKSLSEISASNLVKVRKPESVYVVVGDRLKPKNDSGVTLLHVPLSGTGQFDVRALMVELKKQGLHSLMVEGGAHTASYFFAHRRVQRLHLFQAPSILGSHFGVSWSQGFGVDKMSEKISLTHLERRFFDDDTYLSGRVHFV